MPWDSVSPQCFGQYFVPPPWMVLYLLLDQLDQDFIAGLGLSVGLCIVGRWTEHLDSKWFSKLLHLLSHEGSTLICGKSLRNAESMDDMFCNKLDHLLVGHVSERYCFRPLGEIISSHQYEPMPLGWSRVDHANKVKRPTSERSRFYNWIKRWGWHQLNISKLLAGFASLVVSEAVIDHCRPIKTCSPEHPLHLTDVFHINHHVPLPWQL